MRPAVVICPRPRTWPKRLRGDAGFSLVEVLVAFSVASLTLVVYFEVLGRSAAAALLSADRLTATALAQSKLAGLGAMEPLAEGNFHGAFDKTYTWDLAVSSEEDLAQRHRAAPLRPLNVALKVSWTRGRTERVAKFSTLRLAPTTEAPP